jgi:hypothetical protein
MKAYLYIIIIIALIFSALCVGYYFLYSLPVFHQEQLVFEIMKQSEETAIKKVEIAGNLKFQMAQTATEIRDACISSTQAQITPEFGMGTLSAVPFFYPYKDAQSFVKNERLFSAINAYRACLKNDPRNDEKNENIKKLDDDAMGAWTRIRQFMVQVKTENPDICNSSVFTPATKSMCIEFRI